LSARSSFGAALGRLPVAGEVVVRALVMTAALTTAAISLQLVLYAEPFHLRWFTADWFTTTFATDHRDRVRHIACRRGHN
jgi:hypothetical protein